MIKPNLQEKFLITYESGFFIFQRSYFTYFIQSFIIF